MPGEAIIQLTNAALGLVETASGDLVAVGEQVASVVTVGLQGPAGAPGLSSGHYQHLQLTPLSTWVINHNLGYRPNVSAYTVGGVLMIAEILHVSILQARIIFDQPTSGFAECS